jgi:hypothetical protein
VNIIVHYPKNPEDIKTLQKKVAAVHAEAAVRYINKLPCPKEVKNKYIDQLIKQNL